MQFSIVPVESKSQLKRFVKSQWNFYKGDKNFVPPLIYDRMKLLNTEKNPFYKHSEIKLWTAEQNGEIIGRIAAITNENHNLTHGDKIGFFGFFESINNQEVANKLIETASEWLKSKGKDAIRGPVNPSMNDECAMLIDGFDDPPRILMTYNPRYYPTLMDNAGMQKSKDLFAYKLEFHKYITEKMKRLQGLIKERYQVTIRDINFKDKEQFRKDVETLKDIYNKAWELNWGFVKMTNEEFDFLAADLKPIANPKVAFIVEVKGKPAGFHLGLPDLNQVLIHNKGGGMVGAALNLLTKKKNINIMRIIVLGLLPEFRGTGVDAVVYYESGMRAHELGMDTGEASWILEDNEMMNRGLTTTMSGEVYKKYRIYEKKI
ncbi:GNAT family N-acetyltransferase [Candidatus Kapaibacterium sp.]